MSARQRTQSLARLLDGLADAAARRRGQRPHAGRPRRAAGQRLPGGARHAASTVSSTRRRPWPTARARCCGSRRRSRAVPDLPSEIVVAPVRAPARARQHHRRPLLRRAVARAVGRRHHRHQRQDHLRLSTGAGAGGCRPSGGLHGHHRHRAGRGAWPPARSPPATRSPCSARWRGSGPTAPAAWPWKCPRTPSTRRASARCASAPPRSPISRATISTITAPWRATAPPRRSCSRATSWRRVSSTSTTRSAGSWRCDPRGRGRLIVTSRGHQSHARAAGGIRARHARRTVGARHRARIRFELGLGRADAARWSATSTSTTCSPSSPSCSTGA